MPTYVYKFIETGETIEVQQGFDDETLTEATHPTSGATMPVKKVFLPVGVTFKGEGFYKTDNRSKKTGATVPAPSGDSGSSGSSGDSGSSGSSGDSPSKGQSAAPTSSSSSGSSSSASTASSGSSSD